MAPCWLKDCQNSISVPGTPTLANQNIKDFVSTNLMTGPPTHQVFGYHIFVFPRIWQAYFAATLHKLLLRHKARSLSVRLFGGFHFCFFHTTKSKQSDLTKCFLAASSKTSISLNTPTKEFSQCPTIQHCYLTKSKGISVHLMLLQNAALLSNPLTHASSIF